MRLAERCVPMTNDLKHERLPLQFINAAQGAQAFLRDKGGVPLIVCDEKSVNALSQTALKYRALSIVYDGDALALFSMPDGVGSVLAAGGEDALRAARYFAFVRGVPCALFPASGTLFGAFERKGNITLCGEERLVNFAEGSVYFDLKGNFSLAEAYAQLFLSALARIEGDALVRFALISPRESPSFSFPSEYTPESIVALNAVLRAQEGDLVSAGEGYLLAREHEKSGGRRPIFRAFLELLALYTAFFKRGTPRRYFVCDYKKRAEEAGVPYASLHIPTAEEYAYRALALERMRSDMQGALEDIRRKWFASPFAVKQSVSLYDLKNLKTLPERGGGLSAVIRDFGLLE